MIRRRLSLALSTSLLLSSTFSLTASSPAHADENASCTLSKALKVKVGSAFVTVDGGTKITVKNRRADWSDVVTPAGSGLAATKLLEAQCKLPPRPTTTEAPAKPEKAAKPEKPKKEAKAPKEKPAPKEKAPKPVKVAAKKVPPKKPVKGKKGAVVDEPGDVVENVIPDVTPPPVVGAVAVAPAAVPVVEPAPVEAPVFESDAAIDAPVVEATPAKPEGLRAIRVAVATLERSGEDPEASPRLAAVTTSALQFEIAKLTGVLVIDLDDAVAADLGADGTARLAACTNDECIASIASAVGADDVVLGDVRITTTSRTLNARRLTVLPVAPTSSSTATASSDDDTVRLVTTTTRSLFAERSERAGAVVGPDAITIARLRPPPVPPVATIAVASVAGVGAVVFGVATVVNQLAYSEGVALAQASTVTSPADGGRLAALDQTTSTTFTVLTAAGIGAVVLGVGAGVLAVFTDWQGLHEPPPAPTPSSTSDSTVVAPAAP